MHRYLERCARRERCLKKEIGIDIEDKDQTEQTVNRREENAC
jgi:hypothetical protein